MKKRILLMATPVATVLALLLASVPVQAQVPSEVPAIFTVESLFRVLRSGDTEAAAAAFGQRRKMLRSTLKTVTTAPEVLLESAGVDGGMRGEQLDIAAFARLAQALEHLGP